MKKIIILMACLNASMITESAISAPIESHIHCSITDFNLNFDINSHIDSPLNIFKSEYGKISGYGDATCIINPLRDAQPVTKREAKIYFDGHYNNYCILPISVPNQPAIAYGRYKLDDGIEATLVPGSLELTFGAQPSAIMSFDSGHKGVMAITAVPNWPINSPVCSGLNFSATYKSGYIAQADTINATFYDLPIQGTPIDNPILDTDEAITEIEANYLNAVADMIGSLGMPIAPTSLGVILPNYTIRIKYKNNLGQILTLYMPGVYGIPAILAIPNGNNNNIAENFSVLVGPDPNTQTGYRLAIDKIDANVKGIGCKEIPANISIILSNIDNAHYELGYEIIDLNKGIEGAPRNFSIGFDAHNGEKTNISIRSVPGCGIRRALDVVGKAIDINNDLELKIKMNIAAKEINFTQLETGNAANIIQYNSSHVVNFLSFKSKNSNYYQDINISEIPNILNVCSHSGNACNSGGRRDIGSLGSFSFKSMDNQGNSSPITLNVEQRFSNDSLKLELHNLLFSVVEIDYKTDFHFRDFLRGRSWPKWFFINTDGKYFSGSISRP
jgi:hypothetical protein